MQLFETQKRDFVLRRVYHWPLTLLNVDVQCCPLLSGMNTVHKATIASNVANTPVHFRCFRLVSLVHVPMSLSNVLKSSSLKIPPLSV